VYFEQKQGCQFKHLGIGELFGGRIVLTALGSGTWRIFPKQLQPPADPSTRSEEGDVNQHVLYIGWEMVLWIYVHIHSEIYAMG
jgi:hypothetical protein